MLIFQETSAFDDAPIVKCRIIAPDPEIVSIGLPVAASVNSKAAIPIFASLVMCAILALIMMVSFSRKMRGKFGITFYYFWVIAVCSRYAIRDICSLICRLSYHRMK